MSGKDNRVWPYSVVVVYKCRDGWTTAETGFSSKARATREFNRLANWPHTIHVLLCRGGHAMLEARPGLE